MALSAKGRVAVTLIATLIGVALTANLGAWQLSRAAQKVALQVALESRAKLSPLAAPELNVFLENRQMNGRVGFYLVTPLQLEGRPELVLVQRGFVPRDLRDRTLLPTIATPAGTVEVDGHIAPKPSRLYEFAPSTSGLIRQNLDFGEFALETGLPLSPLSVLQADSASTAGDGLLRQWPRPAVDVQKHYGYAFQWFALCALMAGLYVWFQLVRPRWKRDART